MESYWNLIEHIENLKRIGLALSAEKDLNEFFKQVLEEAMRFTKADGGTVYIISDDEHMLDFQIICTKSMDLELGRADIIQWPSVPLFNKAGSPNYKNFVSYVFHTAQTMKIDDVYSQDMFDNSGTRKYDESNNYTSKSMLAIPLKNHEDKVLGVLQLINAIDNNNEVISFNKEHIATVSSLASQAAIALTNRRLIEGLEDLLDQFIKAIAETIDRKSKYTGGHIERVAEITMAIANNIRADQGFYKLVDFNEDELKELKYASWMHDLGKITTPSHIMDKSTRLETIIDRIYIVEIRFEFIRDLLLLQLHYLSNETDEEREPFEDMLQNLISDWNFIKQVNFEEKQIKSEKIERIEKIYKFKYKILDKVYCLLEEEEKDNLQIPIGTLTTEQNEIMKEHAMVTYNILSGLTFPKKFKNVALYAALHHETLNGTGYPFKYTAEKLPLRSRIIAISDIFESLTAKDRPYKSGKTLSETLSILAHKVNMKEIDCHLMNLILDSGLYLDYAKKYLDPDQIDAVNIEEIKKIYGKNGSNIKKSS
jgi:HD-GYP domain-containing protein (c-di-GMP phosphodiesterase class II)